MQTFRGAVLALSLASLVAGIVGGLMGVDLRACWALICIGLALGAINSILRKD